MPTSPRLRAIAVAAVVAAIGGCAPSPATSPASMTSSPSGSAPIGGLPVDCEHIDLQDPNGARVDLTGEWEGSGDGSNPLAAPDEQVWLQQIGDCLFGSVYGVYPGAGGGDPETFVVDLGGGITPAFTVDLEVVFVYQDARFPFTTYSTMDMIIEWDAEERIRLREDRDVNERAGRCSAWPQFDCPPPVIWYRAGEGPSS